MQVSQESQVATIRFMVHILCDNGYAERFERIPKESEVHIMDGFTTFIMIVGVGTMAYLLTRFLVWLDTPKEHRKAA